MVAPQDSSPAAGTEPAAGGGSTRDEFLTAYAGLTPDQLAVDAYMATTADEVERVRYLAVLLIGYPDLTHPVPCLDGRPDRTLPRQIADAFTRVGALPDHVQQTRAKADAETQLAQARAARAVSK